MKKLTTILMLAFALLIGGGVAANALELGSSTQGANDPFSTPEMEGTIGKYKVCMKLTFNPRNNTVSGWYYYKSKGSRNKIALSGTYDGMYMGGELTMKEKVNGKVTGTFTGEYNFGNWIISAGGTWRSPAGKTMEWDVNVGISDGFGH